jgi:tetratricopeptide (TPR) repeat protein
MTELDEGLKQALALGLLYYQNKEYTRAEAYLTRVVEQNQSFADVYHMLGVVYHDQGHYQKAQRAFEAALRLNPAYTDAALSLAVIYNDTGNYQAARDVYRQALTRAGGAPEKLDPFVQGKLANLYAELGDVWLCAGRHREAVGEYRRALELGPGFVDVRLKLAGALRDAGERTQAIAEYEEIIRRSPSFLPARVALGVVLHAAGRQDEAVGQWEAVLQLSPGHRSAEMYLKMARGDGAAERGAP